MIIHGQNWLRNLVSLLVISFFKYYVYIICIYILKRHYKEIEKSILHKRMMVKKIYGNLKSPYISILTC